MIIRLTVSGNKKEKSSIISVIIGASLSEFTGRPVIWNQNKTKS